MSRPPIHLYTPYFKARTEDRQAELDECLRRNVECQEIDRIVLLIDDGHPPPVRSDKIGIVACGSRPTYRQWLELSAGQDAPGLSILANTDIYFDKSLGRLDDAFCEPETFMALSRYDREGEVLVPHEAPHWSQDTWAVRAGSTLPSGLLRLLDLPMGVPRCDNKIAYLFAVHGWKVVNPVRFIHSVHLHQTQQRNYDKKSDLTVIGGVAYVHPGPRIDSRAAIEVDVWALGTSAIRSVGVNNSLDKWRAEATGQSVPLAWRPAAARTAVTGPVAPARVEELGVQSQMAGTGPGGSSAPYPARTSLPPPALPAAHSPATFPPGAMSLRPDSELALEVARRYRVFRHAGGWRLRDALRPHWGQELGQSPAPLTAQGGLTPQVAAMFVEPVLDVYPMEVADRPKGPADVQFWQYPAATERQALGNHQALAAGSHLDLATLQLHTYLGLPWATYIDKKQYPAEVATWIKPRIRGMRQLAQSAGLQLRVHTVCQHIHWRRFVDHFLDLGVTDLYLSHRERGVAADEATQLAGLRLHSWPLIAVNVEDAARRGGLEFGKPVEQRCLLASFIGAHMPHYRSDVRVRLREAASASGRSDVLVDLGKEWHFNKVVYTEQVAHKHIAQADLQAHESAMVRYNQLLSDSVFSLCPEGAGPNTLRIWESLAVGAIPVIIADSWEPPQLPQGEPTLVDCCIFWPGDDMSSLMDTLARMPLVQRQHMSRLGMSCYRAMRSRTCF